MFVPGGRRAVGGGVVWLCELWPQAGRGSHPDPREEDVGRSRLCLWLGHDEGRGESVGRGDETLVATERPVVPARSTGLGCVQLERTAHVDLFPRGSVVA